MSISSSLFTLIQATSCSNSPTLIHLRSVASSRWLPFIIIPLSIPQSPLAFHPSHSNIIVYLSITQRWAIRESLDLSYSSQVSKTLYLRSLKINSWIHPGNRTFRNFWWNRIEKVSRNGRINRVSISVIYCILPYLQPLPHHACPKRSHSQNIEKITRKTASAYLCWL